MINIVPKGITSSMRDFIAFFYFIVLVIYNGLVFYWFYDVINGAIKLNKIINKH